MNPHVRAIPVPYRSGRKLDRTFHSKLGKSRGSHRGGEPNDGGEYKPGEPVRQSGIYEIIHDREHRPAHDAVMIKGDHFPACEICGNSVRFKLVRTAPYIFQDTDFGTGEE